MLPKYFQKQQLHDSDKNPHCTVELSLSNADNAVGLHLKDWHIQLCKFLLPLESRLQPKVISAVSQPVSQAVSVETIPS